jgi:hypothetical protein
MADVPPISKPRNASRSRLVLIALIVCIAVSSLLFFLSSPFSPTPTRPASPKEGSDWPDWPDDEPFDPIKRYSLEYGNVACWQNDGVWIKHLTPLELSSIGLDRFQDTERSLNQTEEDAFCARLRIYGASFWSLPPRWPDGYNWCETIDFCVQPDIQVNLILGFPKTGGVWVLDRSQGWDKLYPRSLGLLNALTMEERCNIIKDLGGKFCKSMQACPETAALLGDVEVVRESLGKD